MHQLRLCRLAAAFVTFSLVLAGCTGSPGTARSGQVSIVLANTQLNFAIEVADGFRTGVGQVSSLKPIVTGPPIIDGAQQVQMFEHVAGTDTGGITVLTLDPALFTLPLAAAAKRGIPLIAVDNPLLLGSGVKLFIGNDNSSLGKMLADQAISKLGPDATGDIVIGTSAPGATVLDWRAQGMIAEFARRLPHVHVLGPFDTKQEVGANLAAWRLLVDANPHALAFLGTGDADGWHLAAIRKKAKAHWLAGAFDLDSRSLTAVKEGDLLLVSPEHFAAGAVAGHLQAATAKSNEALPKGWVEIPGLAVDQSNIDEVIARQKSLASRQAWFAAETKDLIDHLKAHLRPLSQVT
jgi:ribose transport system substrate-binding protein